MKEIYHSFTMKKLWHKTGFKKSFNTLVIILISWIVFFTNTYYGYTMVCTRVFVEIIARLG